jgi:hypothetical protein
LTWRLHRAVTQLVEPAHQQEIVVVRRPRRTVDTGARNPQKRALSAHRWSVGSAVDERPTVRDAHLPDLLAKKIPLHRQLNDLGVQPLDLPFPIGFALAAAPTDLMVNYRIPNPPRLTEFFNGIRDFLTHLLRAGERA